MTGPFRSSRASQWVEPRPYTDPSLRLQTYGPVQPAERSASLRVVWRSVAGGLLLFALAAVGTLGLVAITPSHGEAK